MDEHRKIRFLYPPLVLLASLIFGYYLATGRILDPEQKLFSREFIAPLLTGGAVVVLACGYLIGTITGAIFALVLKIRGYREVSVSQNALDRIKAYFKLPEDIPDFDQIYPVASFDHACINPGVHAWIQRRWHTCYTSMNCCVALILAFALGPIFKISLTCKWAVFTFLLIVVLIIHVVRAYQDVIKMVEFQSYGPFPKCKEVEHSE